MNWILIPGYNRPEFFYRTMESLVKNPEVKDYNIIFALENDVNQAYFDIIESFRDGLRFDVIKRPQRYGCTRNILEGLKTAIERSDEYVIVVEDDVVVSRDFLRFLDYCYRHFYQPDGDIANIGSSTNRSLGRVNYVYKEQWYLPWGTLIPKYFFNRFLLEHCNDSYYQHTREYAERYYHFKTEGREVEQASLILRVMLKNNLYQILPEVPRSLEIGIYGEHRHRSKQ